MGQILCLHNSTDANYGAGVGVFSAAGYLKSKEERMEEGRDWKIPPTYTGEKYNEVKYLKYLTVSG